MSGRTASGQMNITKNGEWKRLNGTARRWGMGNVLYKPLAKHETRDNIFMIRAIV